MKQTKVPGFRPEKQVPESIHINYAGKKSVPKATIESFLRRTFPHAMSSVTRRALKDSVRIATKFSDKKEIYVSRNFVRYEVFVDMAPEVKWISENGNKNLKIVVKIDNDIDARKASEQELRRRHKTLGAMRIAVNRALQIGDVAVLYISATTIEQQNIPFAEDTLVDDEFYAGRDVAAPDVHNQCENKGALEVFGDFPKPTMSSKLTSPTSYIRDC